MESGVKLQFIAYGGDEGVDYITFNGSSNFEIINSREIIDDFNECLYYDVTKKKVYI